MTYPHLDNAPVVEALIDIQCIWGVDLTHQQAIKKLEDAITPILKEFPRKEKQMLQQIALKAGGAPDPAVAIFQGFLLRSDTQTMAVQFRRNGFTFSRLAPYDSWADLSSNANRIWNIYLKALNPISVSRVAARYINKIQVPYPLSGDEDLITNLRKPLTDPSEYNHLLSFVDQTVSYDAKSGASVGFVRALQPVPTGATEADVVLDIDVFRNVSDLKAESPEVWRIIDSFHDVKNRIFFNAVGRDIIKKYQVSDKK